jgi:hypothetical protein
MKYLVIKGWLGFGDRLESLKMGIHFAKLHNLKVYVDWSDEMWSHGPENFYTYFQFINIDQLSSLDDIPEDATYFPEFWKDNINSPYSQKLIEKAIAENKPTDGGILTRDYDADVIVVGCGKRQIFLDSTFFADVFRVHDQRIKQKIRERLAKFPIRESWGIHIRGTDHVKKNFRSISVQSLCSLVTSQGALNGVKMTVVSDDKENLKLWKNYYPDSFIASELSLKQESLKGNHNLGSNELQFSKDILNVDMLTDFFTLALCARIYSTIKDSRFFREAQRLSQHAKTILGI